MTFATALNELTLEALVGKARPPAIVLAHCMANTKLSNSARMELLNRLYNTLSPRDKLRCRDELRWCLMAKRGMLEAVITRGPE